VNLIEDLKDLPEVRLRIIDLTWSLVNEGGDLDADRLVSMSQEVDEAIDEARAYADETRMAVSCLMKLARS